MYRRQGKNPIKLNSPDPKNLVIKLKDTNGKNYIFKFPGSDNPQWDNEEWIELANTWYHDTINQLLTGEASKRPTRPQWTVQEKHYLQGLIKATMEKKGKNERINNTDWEQIALKLNQRFEGKLCRVGQGYVPPKSKVAGGRAGWSLTAKELKPFERRSATAIQSAIKNWPEFKDLMNGGNGKDKASGATSTTAKATHKATLKRKAKATDNFDEDDGNGDDVIITGPKRRMLGGHDGNNDSDGDVGEESDEEHDG